ncbi:MAG: hypothetical protein QG589_255 [Patescibacteria group bacterium]|nr:hypothetical protein [Patescibacteria group bacterium]
MDKKKIIIIIFGTLAVLLVLFVFFMYTIQSNEATSAGKSLSFRDFFGFGDTSSEQTAGTNANQNTNSNSNSTTTNSDGNNGSNPIGNGTSTPNGSGTTASSTSGGNSGTSGSGYKPFNPLSTTTVSQNNSGSSSGSGSSGGSGGGTGSGQNGSNTANQDKQTSKSILQKLGDLWTSVTGIFTGGSGSSSGSGSSGGSSGFSFKQFFPFGGSETNNVPATSTTTKNTTGNGEEQTDIDSSIDQNPEERLRKLSTEFVAGIGVYNTTNGTLVRHVERATGHVYETELFSAQQRRISNTTIPLLYEAIWGNDAKTFIAQYLGTDDTTISSYIITVANKQRGSVLDTNILSVSSLKDNLFYLKQSGTGSVGIVSKMDGTSRKQIWSSPLKELNSQFVSPQTVALTTKPHPNVPGYMYAVQTSTGVFKKILGNIPGLSALMSTDEKRVLYLSQSSGAELYTYSIPERASSRLNPVTFPEKCVWSKKEPNIVYCAVPQQLLGANSLTNWYMGGVSYMDDIWKYDLDDNTSSVVMNLSDESGEKIDVIKPILSDDEKYLVFINKIDGAPWSLDLTQ